MNKYFTSIFIFSFFFSYTIQNVDANFVFKETANLFTSPTIVPTQPSHGGPWKTSSEESEGVNLENMIFTHSNVSTTTTVVPAPAPSNRIQDDYAQKFLEILDTLEIKVNQIQKNLEKTQLSLAKQIKALETFQSESHEKWLSVSLQMEEAFNNLSEDTPVSADSTNILMSPTNTSRNPKSFDVDIRQGSLPSPLEYRMKNDETTRRPSAGLPDGFFDASQKVVVDPPEKVGYRFLTNDILMTSFTSETPTDDNSSSQITVKNYVPDVGLMSDNPDLIRFLLYNDFENPAEFQILELGKLDSISRSRYDPRKPVKFLVHGFQQNFNSSYPQNVKDAYLSKRDDSFNVIVVDWGLLSIPNAPYIAPVFYPFAVKNVWTTGVRLGEFIGWLSNQSLISPHLVHIVGFSLGSHVSGKAASIVHEQFNSSVGRVTALDPAGPEFYTGLLARKLRADDATYVDAIHTNAGQLGIWKDIGHADFYVNGGSGPQPGCLGYDSIRAVVNSVSGMVTGTCSHNKATEFYAQTILQGPQHSEGLSEKAGSCSSLTKYMLGCADTITFGEHSSPTTRGSVYLNYNL